VAEVEQRFLRELQEKITAELKQNPPPPEAYPETEQALSALDSLHNQTKVDVRKVRMAILQAAHASVPVLKEKGALKAWDGMLVLFQNMNPNYMAEINEKFSTWLDEQKAVPRQPFGLRDAIRSATEEAGQALEALKMHVAGPGERPVAPAPAKLDDESLIRAEKIFASALHHLDEYMGLFGEKELPQSLCGLQAKIIYNRAAIKLAHFQDHRATIYQTGSDYMTEFQVRSDTSYIPSASEMVAAWQNNARGDLALAQSVFAKAATLDEAMKRAYTALAIWEGGELALLMDRVNPQVERMRAMQVAYGLNSGPAQAVIEAMRTSSRALLIVEFP
jgi:hypothetical protein